MKNRIIQTHPDPELISKIDLINARGWMPNRIRSALRVIKVVRRMDGMDWEPLLLYSLADVDAAEESMPTDYWYFGTLPERDAKRAGDNTARVVRQYHAKVRNGIMFNAYRANVQAKYGGHLLTHREMRRQRGWPKGSIEFFLGDPEYVYNPKSHNDVVRLYSEMRALKVENYIDERRCDPGWRRGRKRPHAFDIIREEMLTDSETRKIN